MRTKSEITNSSTQDYSKKQQHYCKILCDPKLKWCLTSVRASALFWKLKVTPKISNRFLNQQVKVLGTCSTSGLIQGSYTKIFTPALLVMIKNSGMGVSKGTKGMNELYSIKY